MRFFSSSRFVRFILAPALGLWLTGVGCLLGCEGMIATAAAAKGPGANSPHSHHSLATVASGESCSSNASSVASGEPNKSHNCCQKNRQEAKADTDPLGVVTLLQSSASSSDASKDCPFASRKTAVVTKSRGGEDGLSRVIAHPLLFSQNLSEQPNPLSRPTLLPNRGHTYLRCCVFLI